MADEAISEPLDSGLVCLVMLSRWHGLAADAEQLKHHYGQSGQHFSETDLLRAAKSLGLKAKAITRSKAHLAKTPLPAIAEHQDGHYLIIAKRTEAKLLIQDPLKQGTEKVSVDAFQSYWNGRLILIARRTGLLGELKKFDFTWFVPVILKYKKLFLEVLLASFFIQLFALVTPLFFQVVIDKVLVHKGLTTLDVLAFGLFVVFLFDVILNGLRTYVFSHTTSRIDVTLGGGFVSSFTKIAVKLL